MSKKQQPKLLSKELFDPKDKNYMYRALFENMSEGALVLTKKGIIVYSNKYFSDLVACELHKVIGSNFYDVIKDDDVTVFSEKLNEAASGRTHCQLRLSQKSKNGIIVIASVTSFKVENETYFSVIVSDISAQKKLEQSLETQLRIRNKELTDTNQKLRQTNTVLNEVNESLDNFVHTIAHDLRAPVANLKLIEKMFEVAPENEKPKLYQSVRENIKVLDNTLKGLVQIIETQDTKEVTKTTIDINKIIEEVKINKASQIQAKNAEIKVVINTDNKIYHVEGYIRSIVRNMISNSLKYTMPGRRPIIKITISKNSEYFILTFTDNGIGIDLIKNRDKLFNPFQRFSSDKEGMGIGLHIVNKMVRRNGGFIKVSSKPEKGTTFSVYLKEYDS